MMVKIKMAVLMVISRMMVMVMLEIATATTTRAIMKARMMMMMIAKIVCSAAAGVMLLTQLPASVCMGRLAPSCSSEISLFLCNDDYGNYDVRQR